MNYKEAGDVHKAVMDWAANAIKPPISTLDIVQMVEQKVYDILGTNRAIKGLAFPVGCSINSVAAHYTPNYQDNKIVGPHDILKLDFGIHIEGAIVDAARTLYWDSKWEPLVNATREATYTAIKQAGIDTRLCDIGAAVSEVITSFQMDFGGIHDILPVKNLYGHNILPYTIHGGNMVPSWDNGDQTKMQFNEVYAIETFGIVGGTPYVYELGECSHYSFLKNDRSITKLFAIHKTLPWCRRWNTLDIFKIKDLCDANIIKAFPPLSAIRSSYISQSEHTIHLGNSKKILT